MLQFMMKNLITVEVNIRAIYFKASLSALNPGKLRSLLYNKVQVQTVYLYILEVLDQLRFHVKAGSFFY
jgi:hypothetical protein